MKLNKICWKNFKSYSNIMTEMDFSSKSSMNLIVGDNGCGKSSIAEVITYLLYGRLEDFTASEIPNRINKNFYGKIDINCGSHNIIIERGLAPSLFEVTLDDKKLDTAGKSSVQSMLEEEYYKIPYTVFRTLLCISIDDFKSLLDMGASDKRNITDKIFGYAIFNQLSKLIKEDIKLLDSEICYNESDIKREMSAVSSYDQRINDIKNICVSQDELDSLNEEINKAKALEDYCRKGIDKLSAAKNELNKNIYSFQADGKGYKSKIAEIDKKISLIDSGKCPTCGSQLDSPEFQEEKNRLLEEKASLEKEVSGVLDGLKLIKGRMDAVDKKSSELKQSLSKSNLVNLQATYKSKVFQNTQSAEPIEKMRDEVVKKIEELNKIKDDLDKKKSIYNALSMIFSEENGVKSYVSSKYTPTLNKIISEVIEFMNIGYQIEFDNKLNAHIMNNGYNVNYKTLSKGEKTRVNFATIISFLKLIKLQFGDINLLFLDELFSNIDIHGISDMIDILKGLSTDMNINIFLIHHAQVENARFDKVYEITKQDGFSHLECV